MFFVRGLVSDGYREGGPTQIVVRPLGDSNSLPKQTKSKSPDQSSTAHRGSTWVVNIGCRTRLGTIAAVFPTGQGRWDRALGVTSLDTSSSVSERRVSDEHTPHGCGNPMGAYASVHITVAVVAAHPNGTAS